MEVWNSVSRPNIIGRGRLWDCVPVEYSYWTWGEQESYNSERLSDYDLHCVNFTTLFNNPPRPPNQPLPL